MRIDLSNLQGMNKSDSKKLDTLKQGDVIKARIIDVKGDMVKIDLGNGEMVEAKLDVPLDLTKGKPMNFVVKDLSDGKLTMSPVYEESNIGNEFVIKNKSAIMDRILTINNLSKDDKNVSIIKNMVSYKMPLKQEDIKAIGKYTDKLISILNLKEGETLETLSNSNPLDIDINKLIKLLKGSDKNGDTRVDVKNSEAELENLIIETEQGMADEANLESIKSDKNSSFKEASLKFLNNANKSNAEGLGVKIDGKSIELNNSNLISEQLESSEKPNIDISKSENIKHENIKLENSIKNIEVKTTSGEKVTISSDSLSEALESAIESVETESTNQKSQLNEAKNIEVKTLDGETKTTDIKMITEALNISLSSSGGEPITSESVFKELSSLIKDAGLKSESESINLKDVLKQLDTETLSKSEFKDVTQLIKNELKDSFNGENKATDLIQKLTFLVKSDVDVTLNNLSRLNKFLEKNQTINKELSEVLELAVKEGVIDEKSRFELLEKVKTLDLKFDGKDSEKLKDFQGNLREASEKLLSTIKSSQNSSEELNQKVNNLNDNIGFLNKINDKNTLMLIPFTMNQKELENSLYVLSKKKVSKSSEKIKVYMNLNTRNLESVKILCDYSYDKLNVNFKVEEDFLKLFETRKIELQQILESKGYENTILTVSRQQEEKVLDIISHDDTINYMLNIKV